MDEKLTKELIHKLDTLIKLTAVNTFKEKPLPESILFLADLGLQNKEVAKILGTTSAYVNKVKYEAKKPKKKSKAKSKSKDKGGK